MKKLELVLTQKKFLADSQTNKLYMNKFYCGFDCAKVKSGDVFIEENLTNDYMLNIVGADIRLLRDMLIPVFSKELNAYHHLNFDESFWKRVISNWFQRIMHNLAFKYLRIKYILQKFQNEYVISANVLAKDEYHYCQELIDLVLNEQSEKYDFQLWSQILGTFERDNEFGKMLDLHEIAYGEESVDDRYGKFQVPLSKPLCGRVKRYYERTQSCLKDNKIADAANIWLARLVETLAGETNASAYMYYPGFSSSLFDRIIVKSKGKIQPLPMEAYDKSYKLKMVKLENLDIKFRKRLKEIVLGTVPKELNYLLVALSVALDNLPTYIIEHLPEIRKRYDAYLLPQIKYLITMHGDYINTSFLLYQAEMHNRFGCKTIGIQHGGSYQMVRYDRYFTDYDEADIFYVWGDKEAGLREHLKSTSNGEMRESAPYKLLSYGDKISVSGFKPILFAGNAIASYAYPSVSTDPARQIDAQIAFLNAIDKDVFNDLEYRNFLYTYGWNEMEIIKHKFPDLYFDNSTGKANLFLKKLMGCEILICDAMETVYMEAIALRKPFMIFMPQDAYLPWESELPYFRLMEEQGLLHYSPEAAADLLNGIYPNIQKWWMEPSRQEAVERIRQRYWHDVKDTEAWWLNEMMRLVGMGK